MSYSPAVAAAWGFFGGGAAECLNWLNAYARHNCAPWRLKRDEKTGKIRRAFMTREEARSAQWDYIIVFLMRGGLGAGMAVVALSTGQICGSGAAVGAGLLSRQILADLLHNASLKLEGRASPRAGDEPDESSTEKGDLHSPEPEDDAESSEQLESPSSSLESVEEGEKQCETNP